MAILSHTHKLDPEHDVWERRVVNLLMLTSFERSENTAESSSQQPFCQKLVNWVNMRRTYFVHTPKNSGKISVGLSLTMITEILL